jgi:hypothetical protein
MTGGAVEESVAELSCDGGAGVVGISAVDDALLENIMVLHRALGAKLKELTRLAAVDQAGMQAVDPD